MEIGNYSGVQSLWDLTSVKSVQTEGRYNKIQSEITSSGDSVSISDEAKKLYSEMIHRYDRSVTSGASTEEGASEENMEQMEQQEGAPAGGGSASSSSGDSVEQIKKQIQALKSQLAALSAQAESGNPAVTAKMNALESQIGALEAQLNEMASA